MPPGERVQIDCFIEAFPKPNAYWSRAQTLQDRWNIDRWSQVRQTLEPGGATSSSEFNIAQAEQNDSYEEIINSGQVSNNSSNRNINSRYHSHNNRIHYRQVAEVAPSNSIEDPKQPVSVKLTAVNQYSYKLTLIINRIQASDYADYTCKASNSLDKSESRVVIVSKLTLAKFVLSFISISDHIVYFLSPLDPNKASNIFLSDGGELLDEVDKTSRQHQGTGLRRSPLGHRVVYGLYQAKL